MNLIKWNYGNPVLTRIFNDVLEDSLWNNTRTWTPATNIISKEDGYQLELAVPGYNKNDIKVEVDKGVLHISTQQEKKNEESNEHYTRKEFMLSSFSKSFHLTDDIDEEKIAASFENGVLRVALPKKEVQVVKSKQIEIS